MKQKVFIGLVASVLIYLAPAVGQPLAWTHFHLWILFLVGIVASITQPAYSPLEFSGPEEDYGTVARIIWVIYLTQFLGVLESVYFHYPGAFEWGAVTWVGVGIMLAGVALRLWAMQMLGRYFTWRIRVQEDQALVNAGPYRRIRHPYYVGTWLIFVGALLFIQAWVVVVIAGVAMAIVLNTRVRHEEAALKKALGETYERYRYQTKAFIPFIY